MTTALLCVLAGAVSGAGALAFFNYQRWLTLPRK